MMSDARPAAPMFLLETFAPARWKVASLGETSLPRAKPRWLTTTHAYGCRDEHERS